MGRVDGCRRRVSTIPGRLSHVNTVTGRGRWPIAVASGGSKRSETRSNPSASLDLPDVSVRTRCRRRYIGRFRGVFVFLTWTTWLITRENLG